LGSDFAILRAIGGRELTVAHALQIRGLTGKNKLDHQT
jgi:hypothetical protein